MQLKIGETTFELSAFVVQTAATSINYLIRMPLANTDINLIKSAKEFSIINGDNETFYNAECTQYRVYKSETDEIEYTFYQEIGARVNELNEKVSLLEVSQQDQDDIIAEILETM